MSVRLTFDGLEELKAQLRSLPSELAGEGGHIVEARGNGAVVTIRSGYPSRTGDLRDHVTVEHTQSAFGARSVIRNTSKHAEEFELGTQARHNKLGANRGSMPANHLFTQTIIRERRGMYDDLRALLERKGMQVSGDA